MAEAKKLSTPMAPSAPPAPGGIAARALGARGAPYLADLNPEQREAVETLDGPVKSNCSSTKRWGVSAWVSITRAERCTPSGLWLFGDVLCTGFTVVCAPTVAVAARRTRVSEAWVRIGLA